MSEGSLLQNTVANDRMDSPATDRACFPAEIILLLYAIRIGTHPNSDIYKLQRDLIISLRTVSNA